MKVIKGLQSEPPIPRSSALAIGIFDGVHLGHQKIIRYLYKTAEQKKLISVVLSFYPHPSEILGKNKIKMLQTIEQRIQEIQKFGIDTIWIIPFTRKFAGLSREEFVRQIIVKKSRAKEIIVGNNFYFGKNREGGIKYLYEASLDHHFNVHSIAPVKKKGETISSSRIRLDLEQGDLKHANLFLGRPYAITGKVIKGRSRGKELGFPTANILPENDIIPQGVYITTASLDHKHYPSVTNIGINPTFNPTGIQVETHLIDFKGDIYSKKIDLQFIQKIRSEKKFDSSRELSIQIEKDIKTAKAFFKRLGQ
jgi:riboflavin kinase/FMN adenylyltransferase